MSTICSNCGEELIGAVNRCWRCGRDFDIDALADIPPVRRMQILPEYLHSSSNNTYTEPQTNSITTAILPEDAANDEIVTAELVPSTPLQLDSPFRMVETATSPQRTVPWLSIALGTGGLGALLCLVTIAGAPLALFAVGITIWRAGMAPARQAWFLLILALFLLLIAAVRTSAVLHLYFFGLPLFPPLTP